MNRSKTLLLSLLLIPAMANARPPKPGEEPPMDGMHGQPPLHHGLPDREGDGLPGFVHGLNLTETQKEQIKALMDKHLANVKQLFEQSVGSKQAIHNLSFSDDYSEQKVAPLIEKSLESHRDIAKQKAEFDHEIFKLLTPEQRQQAQERMERGRR